MQPAAITMEDILTAMSGAVNALQDCKCMHETIIEIAKENNDVDGFVFPISDERGLNPDGHYDDTNENTENQQPQRPPKVHIREAADDEVNLWNRFVGISSLGFSPFIANT